MINSMTNTIKGNSHSLELFTDNTKDRLGQNMELEDKLEVILQSLL